MASSRNRDNVQALLSPFEGVQVTQGGAGDVLECLLGQESLVTGEEYVRVGEEAGKQFIAPVAVANLAEEVVLLVLVHIEADRTDVVALEGRTQGGRVDEPAAGGVDDDDAGLRLREGGGIDDVLRLRSERAVERDDVGLGEKIWERCVGHTVSGRGSGVGIRVVGNDARVETEGEDLALHKRVR